MSPINGCINEINIKIGTYVDAKDVLLEITSNDSIHADFMVYEQDVYRVKIGQKVHFTISNRPDEELTATIFAIGKEFEENLRAVHIHSKINEPTSGLIPGMYISGHIHTDEHYTPTLPEDAIVAQGTKSFIFILDNNGLEASLSREMGNEAIEKQENQKDMTFRMVEVIAGLKDEGYTEITLIDSLPVDTQIVLNAAYYLLADMNKEETGEE